MGSETPMEDLTMDQYTVEVCVLELHPEKDVVHSLLVVNKEEVVERDSGHCPTTFDNSIKIDISDKSKSRSQEDVTGDLNRGTGEKRTHSKEECSSIDTSNKSRSRWQTKTLLRQCEYYTYSAEPNNDNGVDTNDESKTRLHRLVPTTMQEGANQMIKPRTGYDHRYFDNTDASKSREDMNRRNRVNSKTPMDLTLISDSCDESRCKGNRCLRSANQDVQPPATFIVQNRCIEPTMVNMDNNDKCLATNKCVLSKEHSTLMGNQWLSNAFSRFASSVLGKSNEGKVDNINVGSNPNSKSKSKPDFNFFL